MRKFCPSLFLGRNAARVERDLTCESVWRGSGCDSSHLPVLARRSLTVASPYRLDSPSTSRRTWRSDPFPDSPPSPTGLEPSVVAASVCGIRATLKRSGVTSTSVRLTPSTATEPFDTIGASKFAGRRTRSSPTRPAAALGDPADAIDVSLHEMAAQPVAESQRAFEIDRSPSASSPRSSCGAFPGRPGRRSLRRRARRRSGTRR